MNVYDYTSYLDRYKKKQENDPLGQPEDTPSHLEQVAAQGLDTLGVDWQKYTARSKGNTFGSGAGTDYSDQQEKAKEDASRYIAPKPAESEGDKLAAPMDGQGGLNTDLWTKASTSPSGFSFGDDNNPTPQAKAASWKAERAGQNEAVQSLGKTDDPGSTYRAESAKKYGEEQAWQDVLSHKDSFWLPTRINQAKFNQKLSKAQAASRATDRDYELYLRSQKQSGPGDAMFTTKEIYDPASKQTKVVKIYQSGKTEDAGFAPPESRASGVGNRSLVYDDQGVGGYMDPDNVFRPALNSTKVFDGPPRPGEEANYGVFMKPKQDAQDRFVTIIGEDGRPQVVAVDPNTHVKTPVGQAVPKSTGKGGGGTPSAPRATNVQVAQAKSKADQVSKDPQSQQWRAAYAAALAELTGGGAAPQGEKPPEKKKKLMTTAGGGTAEVELD